MTKENLIIDYVIINIKCYNITKLNFVQVATKVWDEYFV